MEAAPHPLQEKRIETLHQYKILDTPRETEFDEIVELASQICETPISVVNLIDQDRQWFKAEVGLNVRETPLDTSICSHVILEDDFVEIPNTLSDPRMADNPLCFNEPGLRFYAGARLVAPNGLPIGTLCVLDNKPRELTDLQRQTLRVLSRQVMRQLDLRLALRNQEVLRGEMDHRVKNSLQTVASLIRLYSSRAKDPGSVEAFEAIKRRVDAIGMLHQELHQASDFETVRLHRFLARVIELLQQSAPENVSIIHEIDPMNVGSSEATAVAVIVSEFVANSVKHAFPDRRQGRVVIEGKAHANGDFEFVCRDNGLGSTVAPAAASEPESLGMRLLHASASQLGTVLDQTASADGYRLRFRFGGNR